MIRAAIAGYGNLGRGAELAVERAPDMELFGIFTRRRPESIHPAREGVRVLPLADAGQYRDEIDVMLVCGGSATDLPAMTPELARCFNCVDSFDTHAKINTHYYAVDSAARSAGRVAVISAGWDPGLFSLARLYFAAVLPEGDTRTFWGRGVSQGHSDAVRRIPGVRDARQYTIPIPEALAAARSGNMPDSAARLLHRRECYIVAEPGADTEAIKKAVVTMPDYFADYDTTVYFIDEAEMNERHSGLPHGGCVLRRGSTGESSSHNMELSLRLDSNPEFTAGVMAACGRAAYRLERAGERGCRTMLDIPPALLLPLSRFGQRGSLL